MVVHALILAASFVVILAGSEMFTNGVEWAGERLDIAEAAVGSLLAAVGTALPETFIPLVALLMSRQGGGSAHRAVGLGAIIGAPLMLSTIALAVMGVAGLAFRKRRQRIELVVPRDDARRDLDFFFPVFLAVVILGALDLPVLARHLAAIALVVIYVVYAVMMLRLKRTPEAEVEHALYFASALRRDAMNPGLFLTLVQVAVGVIAIIFGAREFVVQIVFFAHHGNLNPGVLSLILSPLATELPEKYNSVVWIRQNKDHLALGNITGAMVFQSCIVTAIGLAFSPWRLSPPELLAGAIALISSAILYLNLRDGRLGTPTLMVGGVAYAIFLIGLGVLGVF